MVDLSDILGGVLLVRYNTAMIKEFLMKKMLEKQLKALPKDQQEKIMKMVTENPDLFTKIAKEVEQEVKSGKEQTSAAMLVFSRHKAEIQKVMGQ